MDAKTFRSNPVMVSRIREFLQDPVVAMALVVLEGEMPILDASDAADAIVSVRILSRQFQHKQTILTLLSLADPLLPDPEPEEPTWGVDKSQPETAAIS